ncbi:MAG: branched-chain amino acid transport system substrate-binding protein [Solirubrobacteraceae bacterium]
MHWVGNITRARACTAALILAAVAGAGTLAACGSSNDNGSSSSSTSTAQAGAKSTSTAAAGSTEVGAGVTDYVKYVGGKAGAADTSKSPVTIGFVNQQGGANDVGPGSTDGAKLAVDFVNKYAGGIDGHPVQLHTCFISTAEEQGQTCGQKMANDKAVDVVGVGAVAIGAQPLNASIAGEKPMVWGVSVNEVDTKNKNGYILFGDSFHILAPWGTFGRDVLHAKSAAVVYPQVPGIIEGANAMVKGLQAAGLTVKRVGYEPNATDLVGPLAAAGAQSADMIVPQSDAKGCVNLAKALEQSGVKAPVVSNPLCLSPVVSKGLGGDVPKWYYGIASSLTADPTDPAAKTMVDAMTKLGKANLAADPWVPTTMATVLTIIRFMNAVGADKLSSAAIAEQAKAFKGPLAFGAPSLQCGKYPEAPAVCNDQTKFFKYDGKGKFVRASGFVRPPQ